MCRSVVTTHETKDQTRRNAELTIITCTVSRSRIIRRNWSLSGVMSRSVVTTHETKDQTRRNDGLTVITEESKI